MSDNWHKDDSICPEASTRRPEHQGSVDVRDFRSMYCNTLYKHHGVSELMLMGWVQASVISVML